MQNKNILQRNYTLNASGYQLKLPLNIDAIIPEKDSVRLLSQFVEEMDLTELYSTYKRINSLSPRILLKILLYSYMNGDYSSRSIELNCKRDINFMYLLEGNKAPDHSTLARFRSIHFAACAKNIIAEVTNKLYDIGEISGETIFIDGTKIEACANKYTFVWKKATTKNQTKLLGKIADFVAKCEELYGIKIVYGNTIQLKHVKKLRKKLLKLCKDENITFVYGKGKRKSSLQKSYETLDKYLKKMKEYNQKIYKCGNRNSYSKTDEDATFMRMKEDAMMNGQLKPAYNLQHGVDSEYITWLTIGPQATDTTTLIPFMKEAEEYLKIKYKNIVADAGYESEENYLFLEENEQIAFIKPANYEISKTRKYKNDIGKIDNMKYNENGDFYICKNGQKLVVDKIRHNKTKTGYVSEKTIYKCKNCTGCLYKCECIKGNKSNIPLEERTKTLYVAKKFIKQRKDDLERITSNTGILYRMNRSIQAEGSFADIKQDMNFRRYFTKGSKNVFAESTLLAVARNINKLHNKIQKGKTGTHLFKLKTA